MSPSPFLSVSSLNSSSTSSNGQSTPTQRPPPNFLIILTDEERYPVPDETPELKRFRETELIGRRWLQETGTNFHNHYVAATACSPSRASFFTGHYPTLHGVSDTYGIAKAADDPRINWLEPDTVPTMGTMFRAAGYDTVYKGKWHVSHAEINDENGEALLSVDEDGNRVPEVEKLYLEQQPLDPYGFSDWIGPEPHGSNVTNSGVSRDPTFADQVGEWLDAREQRAQQGEQQKPFLMVASLVNPHDIALFPLWKGLGMELADDSVPSIPPIASDEEDVKLTKPSPQGSYLEISEYLFCKPEVHRTLFADREEMRRFYYYLHKTVDQDLRQMYLKLKATRFYDNTIIIFTSDHGDLLGSHGGMIQKWANAYQESIKIPLVISAPFLPVRDINFVTSQIDILPTMLGLAKIDIPQMMKKLTKTHSEVHPLIGNDFSRVLLMQRGLMSQENNIAYFMTEDEITKGNSQISMRGEEEYDSVTGPCSIESVICYLPNSTTGERELYKFTRYHDNPLKWSHPFKKDVQVIRRGENRGTFLERFECYADEFELYNLTRDPHELKNLAHETVINSLDAKEKGQLVEISVAMANRLETISRKRRVVRNKVSKLQIINPTIQIQAKL